MANASRKKDQEKPPPPREDSSHSREGPPPGYKKLKLNPREKHELLGRYSKEERKKWFLFVGKTIYMRAS